MTTQESLRQEFYKTFTRSFPGDSGMNGNDPQEPVWEMTDDPKEVADWWLYRIDTLLTELEKDTKELPWAGDSRLMKRSDVLTLISNLKQR